MRRNKKLKQIFAVFLSGLLNGVLGTGGGVPLFFMLSRQGGEKKAFATASVGVLILSLQTVFLYQNSAIPFESISPFLPFLAVLGGLSGALLLGKLSQKVLRMIFSLLLLFCGVYLLGKEIFYALA